MIGHFCGKLPPKLILLLREALLGGALPRGEVVRLGFAAKVAGNSFPSLYPEVVKMVSVVCQAGVMINNYTHPSGAGRIR